MSLRFLIYMGKDITFVDEINKKLISSKVIFELIWKLPKIGFRITIDNLFSNTAFSVTLLQN